MHKPTLSPRDNRLYVNRAAEGRYSLSNQMMALQVPFLNKSSAARMKSETKVTTS